MSWCCCFIEKPFLVKCTWCLYWIWLGCSNMSKRFGLVYRSSLLWLSFVFGFEHQRQPLLVCHLNLELLGWLLCGQSVHCVGEGLLVDQAQRRCQIDHCEREVCF